MIHPKRVIQDYLKAVEKYEAYKRECKAKGEEPLPFEIWEKKAIDEAWIEAMKRSGMIIIDLGSTKIVTWPPKERKKGNASEENEGAKGKERQ